jgi:hypothetical protein
LPVGSRFLSLSVLVVLLSIGSSEGHAELDDAAAFVLRFWVGGAPSERRRALRASARLGTPRGASRAALRQQETLDIERSGTAADFRVGGRAVLRRPVKAKGRRALDERN